MKQYKAVVLENSKDKRAVAAVGEHGPAQDPEKSLDEEKAEPPTRLPQIATGAKPKAKKKAPAQIGSHEISLPGLLYFVGASKSGKSYLARYILCSLWLQKKFECGVVFTPVGKWSSTAKYDFIYNEESVIENCPTSPEGEAQLRAWLAYLKEETIKRKGTAPSTYMVIDDFAGEIDIYNRFFKRFIATYRHYGVTPFIISQDPKGYGPFIRTQCTGWFVWNFQNLERLKILHDCCGGRLRLDEFIEMIDDATSEQYRCLYIDPEHYDRTKRFFTMKAPPEKKFARIRIHWQNGQPTAKQRKEADKAAAQEDDE